ncbi:MAG: hypothetical protein KKC46_04030 [Proteobacteria bacterium]|nr:hypothetical protein [Pseudomonadota bacterium]
MPSKLEYLQLSTRVYDASDINKISIPKGWRQLDWVPDRWTGFSAGAYINDLTNEIVISYTGTNEFIADPISWTAGLGAPVPQIFEAMTYYFEVKAANPNADITFTGHSLGGGLASLMAVFFDKKATVFDQAPFQLAALSQPVIIAAMATMGLSGTFDANLALFAASAGARALTRESNVDHYYIEGEVLKPTRLSALTLMELDKPYSLGISTAGSGNRHSIALMTALEASKTFLKAAQILPDLVTQILDQNLFAADNKDIDNEDLLRKLLNHQLGIFETTKQGQTVQILEILPPDKMLDRFAADMNKIAQAGGLTMTNSNITNAMTLFAMQMYYIMPVAINANKELFTKVTGGLQFDRRDVAAALSDTKGFTNYFQNYIDTLPVYDKTYINYHLPNLTDWYIQAGYSAMNATAGTERAFMLGGNKSDDLTGGTANDVLVGGDGADTLKGGKGDDILIGGEGEDIYYYSHGDGDDTIIDSGKNRIVYEDANGNVQSVEKLYNTGADIWTSADGKVNITHHSPWQITTEDGGTITLGEDFQAGDFGIQLKDSIENPTTTNTILGDQNPQELDDSLLGTTGNDRIEGREDDDTISSLQGDDVLLGGTGRDAISAGEGNDVLEGGQAQSINEQGDMLSSEDGNDFVSRKIILRRAA